MQIPISRLLECNVVEKTGEELKLTKTFLSWVSAYVRLRPDDSASIDTWQFMLALYDSKLAMLSADELAGCMMLFGSIMAPGKSAGNAPRSMKEFEPTGSRDRRNYSVDA